MGYIQVEHRWRLSCIIHRLTVSAQTEFCECAMQPASRAFSGLSVASLIRVSGVGGWAFVQWCSICG